MKQDGGVTIKHLGDITKISGYDVPIVDVVTGGSPCQDLSVAGKRAGLAGERSGLFMEQMRIIKEMRDHDKRANGRSGFLVRPRFMVWENVPGAFSSGNPKGADFAAVIEEIIKVAEPDARVQVCVPDGGWTKSGCYYSGDGRWSIAWRLHDAQFWGATEFVNGRVRVRGTPQRRKRVALVADFGGLSAAEILFERKGLRGDLEPGKQEGKGTPAGTEIGFGETGKGYWQPGIKTLRAEGENRPSRPSNVVVESEDDSPIFGIDQQGGKGNASYTKDVAPTLAADSHGTPHGIAKPSDSHSPVYPINTMVGTRDNEETRTTFGVGEDGDPQFTLSAAHEHAVFADVYNGQITGDTAATINANSGASANHAGPTVMTAGFSFGNSGNARSIGYQEECSPTIRGGEGGNQKPTIVTIQSDEYADGKCLNPWDVQSKHVQPEDGIAEALYAGECRYGGGESYCLQGNLIDRNTAMNGTGVCRDVSATLNSTDRHGVAYDTAES